MLGGGRTNPLANGTNGLESLSIDSLFSEDRLLVSDTNLDPLHNRL